MSFLLRQLSKLPVLTETQLAWQRALLDRSYSKDIARARKAKNSQKIEELEFGRMHEMELHDEEEDGYVTRKLLARARRLRVAFPRRLNPDGSPSELWREGRHTSTFCLTMDGMSALREEIRKELKARHELRSQWTVWLAALTGLVGAVTGLIALLK